MDMEERRKERLDRGIKVRTDGMYALMSLRELSYLTVPRLVLIVGMLILGWPMIGSMLSVNCLAIFWLMNSHHLMTEHSQLVVSL